MSSILVLYLDNPGRPGGTSLERKLEDWCKKNGVEFHAQDLALVFSQNTLGDAREIRSVFRDRLSTLEPVVLILLGSRLKWGTSGETSVEEVAQAVAEIRKEIPK